MDTPEDPPAEDSGGARAVGRGHTRPKAREVMMWREFCEVGGERELSYN